VWFTELKYVLIPESLQKHHEALLLQAFEGIQ
jgi:hypothetical protein